MDSVKAKTLAGGSVSLVQELSVTYVDQGSFHWTAPLLIKEIVASTELQDRQEGRLETNQFRAVLLFKRVVASILK